MKTSQSEPTPPVHSCGCSVCQDATDALVAAQHHHINVLLGRLNEPQRRWYAGSLLLAPHAPTEEELSRITGLDEKTIRRGKRELQADLRAVPAKQRQEGGGRFAAEKKTQP